MTLSNYTADAGLTVRQRIIDAFVVLANAMTDDGDAVWREVLMGDLEDTDNQRLPVLGISFGDEEFMSIEFPCQTYKMPMFFNFRFRGQPGVDEHQLFMYYLGLLQVAMLADNELGGLTSNVEEVGNAHTIIGVEGVYPGGTLMANAVYKTRLHNPYKLPFEA